MDNQNKKNGQKSQIIFEHLVWVASGAMLGVWWGNSRIEESKKSRAEQEYPDAVAEVCKEVAIALDRWKPYEDSPETIHVKDLGKYLATKTDFEIEIYPNGPEGKPDVLIDDILALELKVNPDKSDRDRCIGQTAGYSRLWVTWIVLIDTPKSRVGRLRDLLKDKGLERIVVWSF